MTARTSPNWRLCLFCVALLATTLLSLMPFATADPLSGYVDLAENYTFSDDVEEVSRTWESGYVFVPGFVIGEFIFGKIGSPSVQSRLDDLPTDTRYPLIIYLHDAGGVTENSIRLLKKLKSENFAIVLPDSYARTDRYHDSEVKSKDPPNCSWSPDVYLSRRSELIYAVNAARQLSWVDQDNIFLMGSGEGGATVALWGAEVNVSGYIIANWDCTAPAELPWFDGLRTPSDRPTLVLTTSGYRRASANVAGRDGSCAEKSKAQAEFRALSIDSSIRNALALPEGQRAFISFLFDNLHK